MSIYLFIALIAVFTLVMGLIALGIRHDNTVKTFFAGGRNVGFVTAGISAAVSWIWADTLFTTAQTSYDFGIYGLLWFSGLSLLSFIIYAHLLKPIQKQSGKLYTLAELVAHKTEKNKVVHFVLTGTIILYQLFVLALSATVMGSLLEAAFGFNYAVSAASVIIFALSYSLISGLKSSIYTDILQMVMIVAIMGAVLVFVALNIEPDFIAKNIFYSAKGNIQALWNQDLIVQLVIPLAIILLTQPFVDQMIFQRFIALKKPEQYKQTFYLAGIICAAIVFCLGVIGFVGLDLEQKGVVAISDSQLTVIEVIRYYLSDFGLIMFVLAFFAAVFSTSDSVYCAIASLVGLDVYKVLKKKKVSEKDIVKIGRISMVLSAILAVLFSLTHFKILWMLFIIGTIGGAIVTPIIFAMVFKKLDACFVVLAILSSLLVAIPLSIYGNIAENIMIISGASMLSIVIGVLFCFMAVRRV